MKIRVAKEGFGECIISCKEDIPKAEEYTIKALCILQLMCMNSKEDPVKFSEFINILKEAIDKANNLYNGSENEQTPLLE